MERLITGVIIELITISPLLIMARRPDAKWKYFLLFFSYYFIYLFLLAVPNWFTELRIVGTTWNWSGKLYAITGSILFYFLFKKAFVNHNYITFKQNNNSLKPKFFATVVIFLAAIGLACFSINKSETNLEYFLFQFTMPGLDEELAYRGIMLGLLSNSLNSKIYLGSKNLGNPALLITSILFGLCHSFSIDSNWVFYQNWFEFVNVFAIGLLLGWMTIKSGSILMPILIHGLINTLPKIIFWI